MDQILSEDGIVLAYEKAGRADGRGVVLVHGLTGNSDLWSSTASALAPRFRVLSVDLRGHGESGRVEDADRFTLEAAASDVFAVATAEGFDAVTLFGHGMGGDIVQVAALAEPQRVEAMVLVGTGPRPLDAATGWATRRAQIGDVIAERGIEAGWDAYLESGLLGFDLEEVPDEIVRMWRDQFLMTAASAFVGFVRSAGAQPDRTERLRRLDAPALVVVGDDDAAFVKLAFDLADALPNGELATVAGGGHSPQISRAEEFSEIVLDFLKRALPSSRA